MDQRIKNWAFKITIATFLISFLLVLIIVNPSLTYANKTNYKNYSIFHNDSFDSSLYIIIDQANDLLRYSELYNPKLKLDICLNDGSLYPSLIKVMRGKAFAWGFYNKVVMQGTMNCQENYVELTSYKWNFIQLLTHEIVHCLQFDKFGFLDSKPIADIPEWKWEGYAEYISRRNSNHNDLVLNLKRLEHINLENWDVVLDDNTITPLEYYKYWILVQYCIDVKHLTFLQILDDKILEEDIKTEMMNWYKDSKNLVPEIK